MSEDQHVIELFESQGCSSCPPVNETIAALRKQQPYLLILTYHVTYWDYLGWKDTFGKSAFDARQRDYAVNLDSGMYTPMVVVDGRLAFVGSTLRELYEGIELSQVRRESAREIVTIEVDEEAAVKADGVHSSTTTTTETPTTSAVSAAAAAADTRITVNASCVATGSTLHISRVTYDPKEQNVDVKRGENAGRELSHFNVVTEVLRIGYLAPGASDGSHGKEKETAHHHLRGSFTVGEAPAGLERVVIVQRGRGGPILRAMKLQ